MPRHQLTDRDPIEFPDLALHNPLQAQHQLDQLFAAQTLEIGTVHNPVESAIALSRKGGG